RTVPRVNRQAVSRALLKDIGAALVDIHGQSEHLSLLRKDHHIDFLDAHAHTLELRQEFGAGAAELNQMERELESLSRNDRDNSRQMELLNFQIDEIYRAELRDGEEEELRNELTLLTSAEKLKATAYEVYRALYGEDGASESSSSIDMINQALPRLRNIVDTDSSLQPQLSAMEDALLGLEELAREIRSYGDDLAFDPERLEEVQGRLELVRSLKRKYGDSIPEILVYAEKAERERGGLTDSGARREHLAAHREQLKRQLGEMAGRLSERRTATATELAVAVKKELAELGMGRVDFSVTVTQEPSPDGIPLAGGEPVRFCATGADDVTFMASTNPGEPMKPLQNIASTGEISRFLLALKSALADADTTPVLIFDEIDIGVGGRSGEIIGRKLWNLSRRHQVICVTHLPQIAAFADALYTVSKREAGERTVSTIEPLEGDARYGELALMIAGHKYTDATLITAKELINKAETWKKGRLKA
ncbi:MAG: DNA repair protein RecN, partial [Dehalococcoidales bacterium]|nr:DNA repair protein RecN [Dehalococcoidales bacterium]